MLKSDKNSLNYYINQLSSSERLTSLFDILENGFPVVTLVDSIIISGVMEGLHTIDVGVLISPALFQFIAGVASLSNVEYTTGMEEEQTDNAGLISQAMKEARSTPVQDEEEPDELIEIAEEGIEEMHRGLMYRPEPEQGEE